MKAKPRNEPAWQATDFQRAVYEAVRLIPAGKVSSYACIATWIRRGSARTVGTALRNAPDDPGIPCHRVICSDGRIGGFGGEMAGPLVARKERLLRSEGVTFVAKGKVDPAAFM
ncbi:MAG: MGMT family protein [Luteolibacter sp.]|uniref:MGMT family protein n=1 Tax=Luteolibacter sp. TaxID=1962973 RepID=UPI0032633E8C